MSTSNPAVEGINGDYAGMDPEQLTTLFKASLSKYVQLDRRDAKHLQGEPAAEHAALETDLEAMGSAIYTGMPITDVLAAHAKERRLAQISSGAEIQHGHRVHGSIIGNVLLERSQEIPAKPAPQENAPSVSSGERGGTLGL